MKSSENKHDENKEYNCSSSVNYIFIKSITTTMKMKYKNKLMKQINNEILFKHLDFLKKLTKTKWFFIYLFKKIFVLTDQTKNIYKIKLK